MHLLRTCYHILSKLVLAARVNLEIADAWCSGVFVVGSSPEPVQIVMAMAAKNIITKTTTPAITMVENS